jgi:hypothetical protein
MRCFLVNTFSIFASSSTSYMLVFSLALSQILGVLPGAVFYYHGDSFHCQPAHKDNVKDQHAEFGADEVPEDVRYEQNAHTEGMERGLLKCAAPGGRWMFFMQNEPHSSKVKVYCGDGLAMIVMHGLTGDSFYHGCASAKGSPYSGTVLVDVMGGSAVTLACAARAASESGLQVPAAAVRLEERQQIASRHVDEDKARFYKERRKSCRNHWRITNTSQTHDPGMMFVFRATNVHGQGSVPLPCMPLCSILAFYNKIRNRVDIDLTCGDPPLYVILGLDPGTRLVNGKVKAWSSFLQVRWKKGAEWKTFKAGDDGRVRAACLEEVQWRTVVLKPDKKTVLFNVTLEAHPGHQHVRHTGEGRDVAFQGLLQSLDDIDFEFWREQVCYKAICAYEAARLPRPVQFGNVEDVLNEQHPVRMQLAEAQKDCAVATLRAADMEVALRLATETVRKLEENQVSGNDFFQAPQQLQDKGQVEARTTEQRCEVELAEARREWADAQRELTRKTELVVSNMKTVERDLRQRLGSAEGREAWETAQKFEAIESAAVQKDSSSQSLREIREHYEAELAGHREDADRIAQLSPLLARFAAADPCTCQCTHTSQRC